MKTNKKLTHRIVLCILSLVLLTALCACNGKRTDTKNTSSKKASLWDSAVYTQDTSLGSGGKTLTLSVIAENKTVKFTVKSDAKTVGEALLENKLIEGENGSYGLYVKKVDGIVADYDVNKSFWSFNKDSSPMPSGVDATPLNDGDKYEFKYTK